MDQTTPGNRPLSNNPSNAGMGGTLTTNAGGTGGAEPSGVSARVDDLASRAHRTIDRAASSAQPMVDRLASNAHDAVDRVSSTAVDAAEGIDSRLDDFGAARDRMTDQCREYIEDNPLKAVGIALLAGFILAKLI